MSFQDLIVEKLSKTAISDCFKYFVAGDKITVYNLDGLMFGSFTFLNMIVTKLGIFHRIVKLSCLILMIACWMKCGLF